MAIDGQARKDPRGKVMSQFQVFWNDPSPKQVVVLQFPNRRKNLPYSKARNLQPSQFRWKPNTGLVEVDVPLDSQTKGYFSKEKALESGLDLARNKTIGAGGSFGLAGGFGVGGISLHRGQERDDPPDPSDTFDKAYNEAEAKGMVLKNLTLSGKIQQCKEGDPIFAMATFKGDEIHLTRVHAICSLSPQYIHLDAATDNEKANRIREAGSSARETEARAVTVSVRAGDAENAPPDDIGKVLRAIQEESWQRMQWTDEEADQAYLAFQNHLFYKDTNSDDRLVSMMSLLAYLDAISAPKVDDKVIGQKMFQQHKASVADDLDESTDSDESDVQVMQEEGQRRHITID